MVKVGCNRFRSDCDYLCDSAWYIYGPNLAKCVGDNTKAHRAALDFPVLDAFLARECRADVQKAACVDIPRDTLACDLTPKEGCPEDLANLGAPYSWIFAARLKTTPSEFSINLRGKTEEWLLITLEKGDVLTLHGAEDEPSFGNVRAELHVIPPGRAAPNEVASERLTWGAEAPAEFAPVDNAGDYYVKLRASETLNFTLRVDVKKPPLEDPPQ